jgi:hypothetical protein
VARSADVRRRAILRGGVALGCVAAAHGCALFPDLDHLTGSPVPDAGRGPPDVEAPQGAIPICRNGSERDAVSLKRRATQAYSWFGLPVAADDITMVVGAPLERQSTAGGSPLNGTCGAPRLDAVRGAGTVRVFEGSGEQTRETMLTLAGIEQSSPIISTELVPPLGAPGVYQSIALAISGDWLAVGMAGDDSQSPYRGSVRLFHRELGAWRALPDPLVVPNGREGDLFGASMALAGNTLVVGAPGEDAVGGCDIDCGAMYVYTLGAAGPGLPTKIVSPSPTHQGWFGLSVAVTSDFIVAGAPLERNNAGVVYVYDKSGNLAFPIPPQPELSYFFGLSVSVRGDELAVGVPGATPSKDRAAVGAVSLYRLAPNAAITAGATHQWAFYNPDPVGAFFGMSVALGARGLIVGAPISRPPAGDAGANQGPVGTGSTYVFERNDRGELSSQPCRLSPPAASACDTFGAWVAATDGFFVVGAPRSDVASATGGAIEDTGAVYLYAVSATH